MPRAVSPEQYLTRAVSIHGVKYTYDISTLRSSKNLVPITCGIHGVFYQLLANHLQGAGCPKCAGKGVDWVSRFRSVHGDAYDYSKVTFWGYKSKVEIVCPQHGSFWQTPDNHYRGRQGCPKCKGARIRASKQMSITDFIARATSVHGGRFTYAPEQFSNQLTGVVAITCPLHGVFYQNPVNHLAGKIGCTKCNHMKSAGEEAVAALIGVFASVLRRDRKLIGPRELDIYAPAAALAVEYCGEFWHSCGSAQEEAEAKRKHYSKYVACRDKGVHLITLYESEWLNRTPAICRLLRNALGKSRGRLMARKCELRKVLPAEAKEFFEKYHPQGGNGVGEHYALFWRGKMVACMRFTFGGNDRGVGAANRTWTLSRYATRVTVAGAASRLFNAFLKAHNPTEVKSFSDNRFFEGGMYERLGFTLDADLPPDYQVWSPKLGLLPKANYQRRSLPARLKDHGLSEVFDPETDPRSEAEMTYLMGARRLYDCGKKRWVWRLAPQSQPC